MTQDDIARDLAAELHRIAPDIDPVDIDRNADIRDEMEIDSMDFLTLVTALSGRYGISIPEADYPQMDSFNAIAAYLAERTA